MKSIGPFRLGLTFAGCFLGAGYISGQELWQFFGCFGAAGLPGVTLAVALQVLFGILILWVAKASGSQDLDSVVIRREIPWLRHLVGSAAMLFLFGVATIMAAGAGALGRQLFGFPAWAGSCGFCLLVGMLALFGFGGIISAFSVFVPVLVAFTLALSFFSIAQQGFPVLPAVSSNTNPLLGNWLLSAATFVSYTMFFAIGIILPLAEYAPRQRTVTEGVAFGGLVLLGITAGILLTLFGAPGTVQQELPMLAYVCGLSGALGDVYGVLLLCGMTGSALSSLITLQAHLMRKLPGLQMHSRAVLVLLLAVICAASLAGFGSLIWR